MLLAKGLGHGDADEEILISGGGDGSIKLWQIDEDAVAALSTLENGDNSVLAMALDGNFLYSGRSEGDFDVWDLDTRQLIRTVKAHNADVLTVAVGHDFIFTGSASGWAKVFKCWTVCTSFLLISLAETQQAF